MIDIRRHKPGTFTVTIDGKTTHPIPYGAGIWRIRWAFFRAGIPIKVSKP